LREQKIKTIKKVLTFLFGVYAWAVLVFCVLFGVIAALIVPSLDGRRRWVSAAARGVFRLTATPCRVSGLEKLPSDHCVVIANHASYLDGIILKAFLPPRFAFVIKGEMRKFPVVSFMLHRIGSKFVERFVVAKSARDARAIVKSARQGESIAIFPEGTFIREPGLGRFRPGAFSAAINGQLPVVPVVIHGSRHMMPADQNLPVPGRITIDVLDPIPVSDPAFESSARLAALSRERILAVLEESDLLAQE
jgi:1-acyl-sn-glycerol-3-phosphate acyltransferase